MKYASSGHRLAIVITACRPYPAMLALSLSAYAQSLTRVKVCSGRKGAHAQYRASEGASCLENLLGAKVLIVSLIDIGLRDGDYEGQGGI